MSAVNFHNSLRARCPDAVVARCKKSNRELELTLLPNIRTVLDADTYAQKCNHTGCICDFFVFWSGPGLQAAAVEMKGRAWKASEVQQQLQAGAQVINALAGTTSIPNFQPILVYESAKHSAQIKSLGGKKIRFRGKDFRIIRRRCGEKLDP